MGKSGILIIAVILLVLISSGCIGGEQTRLPTCSDCPTPSTYSDCTGEAVKIRTNYRCSAETSYACESYTEEKQCKTEIALTGNMGATVSPSIEEKVKGVIKIETKTVPEGTNVVAYYLAGNNLPPIEGSQRISWATNQGDVWTGFIDTTGYENGLYDIAVLTTSNEAWGDGSPEGYAMGKILISNN